MNKRSTVITAIFMLLFCISLSFAQSFEFSIKSHQGIRYQNEWGYFQGGLELLTDYRVPTGYFDLSFGLNARTVQWGTQVSISSGISRSFGKFVELSAELQNGLALFQSKPLYVYSIGLDCRFPIIRRDKISAGLSVGGRFTQCPAYSHYGSIDHVVEIPVGLFLRF